MVHPLGGGRDILFPMEVLSGDVRRQRRDDAEVVRRLTPRRPRVPSPGECYREQVVASVSAFLATGQRSGFEYMDWRTAEDPSFFECRRHFGAWSDVLKAAGA